MAKKDIKKDRNFDDNTATLQEYADLVEKREAEKEKKEEYKRVAKERIKRAKEKKRAEQEKELADMISQLNKANAIRAEKELAKKEKEND